jgi:GNAT superfamily N-acetyltransferase
VTELAVVRVRALEARALAPLLAAADAEGARFVRRLHDEWHSGENRFDRVGEALFAIQGDGAWLGVGGVNVDPYADDPRVGRVRHFFVRPDWRRRECGAALLEAVIAHARGHFERLILNTTAHAGPFYERRGFVSCAEPRTRSTHALELHSRSASRLTPARASPRESRKR